VTWIGNSATIVELAYAGDGDPRAGPARRYTFVDEFETAIDLLATGRLDVRPLIELTAPLEDAPGLFQRLGNASLDAVKVVLVPG
jgi:L-iditol 2-dehydrogenase